MCALAGLHSQRPSLSGAPFRLQATNQEINHNAAKRVSTSSRARLTMTLGIVHPLRHKGHLLAMVESMPQEQQRIVSAQCGDRVVLHVGSKLMSGSLHVSEVWKKMVVPFAVRLRNLHGSCYCLRILFLIRLPGRRLFVFEGRRALPHRGCVQEAQGEELLARKKAFCLFRPQHAKVDVRKKLGAHAVELRHCWQSVGRPAGSVNRIWQYLV